MNEPSEHDALLLLIHQLEMQIRELAELERRTPADPTYLGRRIRRAIGTTVVLALLAFLVLIPVGAAAAALLRLVARMLSG